MKVSTVEEMRGLDAAAIKEYGIPDHLLMENAGEAVYYVILRDLGVSGLRFTVISGPGNNGGDGFVVGRKLHSTGAEVRVLVLSDPASYSGPARVNLELLERSGVPTLVYPKPDEVADSLAWCDAIVDGLLGTGIKGEVGGLFLDIVRRVNESGKPVFSIDIPSGVNGDTGQVQGAAVQADRTVSFGLPKRGNLLGVGAGFGGRLVVSHISFPPGLIANADIKVEVSRPAMLPPSQGTDLTDSARDVLFIAGAQNPVDSTAFASMALVEIAGRPARFALPRSLESSVEGLAGKIVLSPQEETDTGTLALGCLDELLHLGQNADLVVFGPGRSPAEETQELTRRFCERVESPLLLIGDELAEGCDDIALVRRRAGSTIWLLQPSEMSRLGSGTLAGGKSDLVGAIQGLSEELGAIMVLRANPVLIGLPNGRVLVDLTDRFLGLPAGRCNVLPGVVGAMCRLGLPLEDAVRTGVFLRGLAGNLSASERGDRRITARQIVGALPRAIKAFREDYPATTANFHGAIEVI
jgi:NAD(P)H-hydrate epimerase